MLAQRSVNGRDIVSNFPLPQPDLSGFCDNFKSPSFLVDVSPSKNSCVQQISNFQSAAQTFMNPVYYTLDTHYLSSGAKSFEIGNIYVEDSNGVITDGGVNSVPPAPAAGNCRTSNVVKELRYRVYYKDTSSWYYEIDSITIDMILQAELEMDDSFCDGSSTGAFPFVQNFGIEFVIMRDGTPSTMQGIAETG
jgi:hypothetical protein